MKYIVISSDRNKGMIVNAKDVNEARKIANREFYAPFHSKNDLMTIQRYELGNHMLCSVNGQPTFNKVQFYCGNGIFTLRNVTIDTQLTKGIEKFLGNEIIFVRFFNNGHKEWL